MLKEQRDEEKVSAQMEEVDERVLAVAARLFSELGYDATSLGMIADAVGKEAEGSGLLRHGKQRLYHDVLARLYALEMARLEPVAREAPDGAEGVHRLVDAFLDFVVDHPEFPALWWQRGLKDAIDLRFPEEEFPPPLLTMMTSRPWQGLRPGLDLEFISWTIIWTVAGFVNSALFTDRGPAIGHFRARLHALLDRIV